uniref:Uncharacterized protein n=1 Tax=Arundo donax TaxID=35708 RepID=A0A0A9HBQ1_ARUDO
MISHWGIKRNELDRVLYRRGTMLDERGCQLGSAAITMLSFSPCFSRALAHSC